MRSVLGQRLSPVALTVVSLALVAACGDDEPAQATREPQQTTSSVRPGTTATPTTTTTPDGTRGARDPLTITLTQDSVESAGPYVLTGDYRITYAFTAPAGCVSLVLLRGDQTATFTTVIGIPPSTSIPELGGSVAGEMDADGLPSGDYVLDRSGGTCYDEAEIVLTPR